ncbi:P-type ATPase-like protein [Thamnocephalis sphaerospora]|uniref:Cation-transporting ATPase n=1 Tax=Thamnocephalis sphaerospora TaxID=78915 RepID=A0A4P9XWF7_9FUNG|nr:P-type ATPase-like protein [Thamnocephalis sphaerospora]|eukprot:RKP10372.1 P-type ATPase-like protein [Thamnocephalis sphaerospora]
MTAAGGDGPFEPGGQAKAAAHSVTNGKQPASFPQDTTVCFDDAVSTSGTASGKKTRVEPELPLNPVSQQRIYLAEEELELVLTAYRYNQAWLFIYRLVCVFTAGVFYLIARWLPRLRIRMVAVQCPMGEAEWIVVENQWHQLAEEPIRRFQYGGRMANVFSAAEDGEKLSKETLQQVEYFDHRYMRFIYHPRRRQFVQTNGWWDASWTDMAMCARGVSRETYSERKSIFGANLVDVAGKSLPQLLVDEVLHPFYVFQIFSVILWCFDNYFYYAGCILLISAISIVQTLVETRQNINRMREMSRFVCDARVFRNGRWHDIASDDLVPGDLVDISEVQTYPCDMILLSGDCIVNESMLTGESVPVSKTVCVDNAMAAFQPDIANVTGELSKHFLFGGTKAVRVRPMSGWNGQDVAVAMVVRTGFNSTKGALVRSMLYPRPNKFKFYRDSFRFIGVLACIAFLGFIFTIVNFVRLGLTFHRMILRALDLITVVVPPALPATLSIGTSFAIHRMRKAKIYCISPPRVNVGGKIDMMCFDKTGTLTEDGLDVLGVRYVDQSAGTFVDLVQDPKGLPLPGGDGEAEAGPMPMLYALASCHSLNLVHNELIGDPLDLKMFDFTRWTLEENGAASAGAPRALANNEAPALFGGVVPTVVRPPGARIMDLADLLRQSGSNAANVGRLDGEVELGILRCFEFAPALRRMSVLVKQLGQQSTVAYVKGAPEVMRDICQRDSLPHDYEKLLADYTHKGYRVIACAAKDLGSISWIKAQRITRERVESDLRFLGFIIFENKLKPTTAGVIGTLHHTAIRQVMCTGDNVLTAVSVSRECGLIRPETQIYVPRLDDGCGSADAPMLSTVVWENIDSPAFRLDPYTLRVLEPTDPKSASMSACYDPDDYELAITGDVFRWMVDHAPRDLLNRMLVKSPIFARMSPDEKQELVENFQQIGYCVGFCGDGANDCGALRSADVGISLSEEEASVAAPFTSVTTDIRCVIKVIREGRAALVTSFSCFKFMALYSMIQFTTVSLLYSYAYQLGDLQYLFIDLFIIMPVAVAMGRTGAYPKLSVRRPTASLVSRKVLISLISQIIVHAGFQLVVYYLVTVQSWYIPPAPPKSDEENILCYENAILFTFSCFQYFFVAIVFSVGKPFRKSMFTNAPFIASIVALIMLSLYMLMDPAEGVRRIMNLVSFPLSFRWTLLCLVAANFVVCFVVEWAMAPHLARIIKLIQATWRRQRGKPLKKNPKPYKLALKEMR